MNKENYKNTIEEHRKPITLDGEERTNSRTSRRLPNQSMKQVKMRKNPLLPILFSVFILIPVGFLIYIQVFYEPNQNETAVLLDTDEFEIEQNEENRVDTEVADEIDENETESGASENDDEGSSVPDESTATVEETPAEEIVEEPAIEETTSTKSHTVQPDETLYRIAMNYYNSPDAVQNIKDANGLTSDSISSGQVLILP